MKPIIAPRADHEVDAIVSYLTAHSPAAADRFVVEFQQAVETRAGSPKSGRARDELESGLRSFVVSGKYVVFYRPAGDTIEVVRVIHGSRNIEAVFREDE